MSVLENKKVLKISASYLSKIAILTAISFILYAFAKFPLPFIFPSFLDMQFSELPALLAAFSMGPVSGCLVIVLKCLLKFPLSSTAFVGEITDMIIGIAFVLPSGLIYKISKDKKHAIMGIILGLLLFTATAVILNRFVSIPFYLKLFFNNDWNSLLNTIKPLYNNISKTNFYTYYLLLAVVPFNILRGGIVAALTFFIYKRLSKLLHWEGGKIDGKSSLKQIYTGEFVCRSIKQTQRMAETFAKHLSGGEVILLNGDLGAGKTTFTKYLGHALGIPPEIITSPTFTIMKEYKGKNLKLYHYDMYRLSEGDEKELGIDEYLYDKDGVCVIEWNKFCLEKFINIDISIIGNKKRKFIITEKK